MTEGFGVRLAGFALGVSLAVFSTIPVSAQQENEQAGPTSQEAEEEPFNPRPFLTAMVNYRIIALTCDDILPVSPVRGSQGIVDFFEALGQPAPTGRDKQLDGIIYELIRAQAASICVRRLRTAEAEYARQAEQYRQRKPEEWPEEPSISSGPFCESNTCAELR